MPIALPTPIIRAAGATVASVAMTNDEDEDHKDNEDEDHKDNKDGEKAGDNVDA